MSLKSFDFEIVSATSSKVIKVEWVEIEAVNGCFLVGFGHAPLVSIVKRGNSLLYKQINVEAPSELFVSGGIFSVANNKAKVVLDF
jgi:F0F1-type ATP synthase epsilon subunit